MPLRNVCLMCILLWMVPLAVMAQCDTVYHGTGVRVDVVYSRPADPQKDTGASDAEYNLQRFLADRQIVGKVALSNCTSAAAVDFLLDDLMTAYKNKDQAKKDKTTKRWLTVLITYPSDISLRDLIVLLNHCRAGHAVDVDLISNQIALSLRN